jgi:hypothetical protein
VVVAEIIERTESVQVFFDELTKCCCSNPRAGKTGLRGRPLPTRTAGSRTAQNRDDISSHTTINRRRQNCRAPNLDNPTIQVQSLCHHASPIASQRGTPVAAGNYLKAISM